MVSAPRLLVCAVLGCLVTACGTTLPQQSVTRAASGGSLSAPGGGPGGGLGPGSQPVGIGGDPSRAATGPQGSTGFTQQPGSSTPLPGPGASSPPSSSQFGPPRTSVKKDRSPVRVGVLYVGDFDTASSAEGISGVSAGDTAAQAKAFFDDVNAHGGLAGRRISGFYRSFSAASTNPEGDQQAACAGFVQDDHVQFVTTYETLYRSTMTCFAKGGVTVLSDVSGLPDSIQRDNARHFAAPGDFAPGRVLTELVDALWRTGWLTRSSVIGTITVDSPDYQQLVDQAVIPALRAHGLQITDQERLSTNSSGSAQYSSASLKFANNHVDRVIPVAINPLLLMIAASSQHYNPRYAVISPNGPGAVLEAAAPRDQLAGAAGVGWQPFADIGAGNRPEPFSPTETRCFAIMAKAGQSSSNTSTRALELNLCTTILYLEAAANRYGSVPADLRQAGALLGTSFVPGDTFRSDVSHRVDGAAGYRDLAYQQSCSCFEYVGGLRTTR